MAKKRYLILFLIVVILAALALWHGHANAPAHDKETTGTKTSTQTNTPKAPAFDKTKYSTTDPASIWVIVNKQHPLQPKTYAPGDLVSVGNGQYMRAEAANALQQMLAGAQAAGYSVTPASGYRSYDTQVTTYNSEVAAYGQAVADSESARPGYSEHQTGLAIDLASGGCSITDCFGSTPGGKWVTENAYKYGFLLRYPDGYTDITGYRTETWHFRYIGTLLSEEMHKEGVITLEQFFGVSGGTEYK